MSPYGRSRESIRVQAQPQGRYRPEMDAHATLAKAPQPRLLMCPPQHFAVTYSINPWMDPQAWADSGETLHATAVRQWAALRRTLVAKGAAIEIVEPAPDLPDLVF